MVKSAFTAPHATLWLSIDMTETMNLVRTLRADKAWANVRVTPLLILAKAILLAVRRNPGINASWDDAAQEIVTKHYVNLGIAAATPRGLIVPNIKNADRLPLNELAVALDTLVTRAREGHTAKEDMTQGTFTITNVGVFGIDGATPILNPGEAGILAVGATRTMPWVVDDQLSVREIAQLSLSIDHRVVDGELGSRFLADVGRIMERPSEAFFFA
ncbi:Dihydrolipoyllysine-residue acetyltransferase component of pyruvate dehydrogenase complex (plasmid) [Rhodococcus opacus PD630]|nr:Dihydrolipoyllysine-residue acetyltransferase component of pyruvate dehydrogenase complex [Rhodococcus opacus PD630]